MKDLRLLLRDPSDIGCKRSLPTPSPEQLLQNTENFIQKWISIERNEAPIINENVIKELNALKVHMQCGCLSNIQIETRLCIVQLILIFKQVDLEWH